MLPIADWLRQAAPYINSHRGKTFVIKISGDVLADATLWESTAYDIALLHSLGIKVVLVFGAREQINHALSLAGIETAFDGMSRITPPQAMPVLQQVAGQMRFEIESMFSRGTPSSPLYGASVKTCSGNFIIAKPSGVINGHDYQHTGEVRRVETDAIRAIIQNNAIALLSPIGVSITGQSYNLNAEQVAVQVAAQLQAHKLIFIGKGIPLSDNQQQRIRECDADDLRQQTEPSIYIQAAQEALALGIERVHLVDSQEKGALIQELFTRDGSGTLITQSPYEQIRSATIADISAIIALIEPLEQKGILVKRAREQLENEIYNFYVMTRDQAVIGCAALYPFAEGLAEIACVVIHPNYQAQDRGETLLETLEQKAQQQGISTLFVLTTQTEHWFIEQGFTPAPLDRLPKTKQMLYNYDRNSKVLIKTL